MRWLEAYRSPFAHLRTVSDGSTSAYRLIEPDTDVLLPATGLAAPLRPARAAALEPVKFRARNATVSAIEPRRAVTKIVLIAVSNIIGRMAVATASSIRLVPTMANRRSPDNVRSPQKILSATT